MVVSLPNSIYAGVQHVEHEVCWQALDSQGGLCRQLAQLLVNYTAAVAPPVNL